MAPARPGIHFYTGMFRSRLRDTGCCPDRVNQSHQPGSYPKLLPGMAEKSLPLVDGNPGWRGISTGKAPRSKNHGCPETEPDGYRSACSIRRNPGSHSRTAGSRPGNSPKGCLCDPKPAKPGWN